MQFNGTFMTSNRRFSFSVTTPTALTQTTIKVTSAQGEFSVTRHIDTYVELEKNMIAVARIIGGGDDASVLALARMIGESK
jgi:hypothetical protein